MSHKHLFVLLGVGLGVFGVCERSWLVPALWLGGDFIVLGIAHARGWHRIFGKRPGGTLPLWSWIAFLPLLVFTYAVWHVLRLVSHEPAHHAVTKDLIIGRRLLRGEITGDFANFVDLTAEFTEPSAFRTAPGYISFSMLDGGATDVAALRDAIDRLRPGRTFIHCAQGHGRTGLFALALMLRNGSVKTVTEGLEKLKLVRPGVQLTAVQRRCI